MIFLRCMHSFKTTVPFHAQQVLFIFLTLFLCQAHASLLNINPVSFTLSHLESAAVLEIKNRSQDKVIMQADAVAWSQKENQIVTSSTHELLVTPPVFELAPNQVQLLRLVWMSPRPLMSQSTYRIILREVSPLPSTTLLAQTKDKLKINLLISIPVFIQPIQERHSFKWKCKRIDKEKFQLIFNNLGNMTTHIHHIHLLDHHRTILRQHTFAYVLPHHHYSWVFTIKKNSFDTLEASINEELKAKRVEPCS